eukprot:3163562-Pleurochrysis_carterae.AAC.1
MRAVQLCVLGLHTSAQSRETKEGACEPRPKGMQWEGSLDEALRRCERMQVRKAVNIQTTF